MCKELDEALLKEPFFNCVGGCGVDTSNGNSNCMNAEGIWFKYCPFCGKKIISKFKNGSWNWKESDD